jgi:hypothetical protein
MDRIEAARISIMNAISKSESIAKDLFPACHAINPRIHRNEEVTKGIVVSCLNEIWSYVDGSAVTSCSTGSIHAQVRFYDDTGTNCETHVFVTSHRNYGSDY